MTKPIGSTLLLDVGVLAVVAAVLIFLFRDAITEAVPLLADWPIAFIAAPLLLLSGTSAIVVAIAQRRESREGEHAGL